MAENGRSRTMLWVVVGGGGFFLFLLAVFAIIYTSVKSDRSDGISGAFGDKIAVVDLEGVIVEPKTVVSYLKKYGDDDSIKAIIIHVNTPGGGAAASQEIYEAVKRVRTQKKKRIVASIETVGASGGYYVASACDKIYANPASVVGSIGVIAEWYNYGELIKWAKLKDITIKTGEFKDTGTPNRDLTPAERVYLQALIDDMYTQFINAVAEGRKMKPEEVRALADGKVWTGSQAVPLKLVDQLTDFQGAVDDTAKAVGISGEPTLVRPQKERRTLLDVLAGNDLADLIPTRAKLMETHVGFYYLWK
ncbi:MAG: signal peptide peptidase SppA [Acidobacteriota bacterium]|nr:signal peptide peptidase SppA [Acidobacteriota bacterium]